MYGYRRFAWLVVLVSVVAASGASCPRDRREPPSPLPQVLSGAPTLNDVIAAVNRNALAIQSFSTNEARLTGAAIPVALEAKVAFQRPMRFRLRAGTGFTGAEVDLGSNDELFWFWVRHAPSPALYFARHDEFASCRAREMVPIEPQWLVEALGVTGFDPSDHHEGPYPKPNNRLEIRSTRHTPNGMQTKITLLDAASAAIVQQRLYDYRGTLVAVATVSEHRRDPLTSLILPKVIDIECPRMSFSMRLDLGPVQINQLAGDPAELWTMPAGEAPEVVDLCDPRFQPTPPPASQAVSYRRPSPHRQRRIY